MDPTNPTPLPRHNNFPTGPLHDAYDRCLCLELHAQGISSAKSKKKFDTLPDPPLAARILGYLLLEVPAPTGKDILAREVNECATDEEVRLLAQLYLHYFILAFKRRRAGITPAPSDRSSGRSFDEQRQMYHVTLNQKTLDHHTATAQALVREDYRCPFTGRHDMKIRLNGVLSHRDAVSRGIVLGATHAAHIIPEPTSKGIKRKTCRDKRGWASSVWAVLARFSASPTLPDDLEGQNIHRLENLMTMDIGLHIAFDSLQVWLEPTGVPNEYRPRSVYDDFMVWHLPNPVVFNSPHPDFPVPSPVYISLHAACARVANLSGAAEYVESMWRDMEDTRVLSTDGGS